jgi:hypothetical protein
MDAMSPLNGEISHVSDTALMVAACLALVSETANGLVHDPFAALALRDCPLKDPVAARKVTAPLGAASLDPAPVKLAVIGTGVVDPFSTVTAAGIGETNGASALIAKLFLCVLVAAL